MMPVRPMYLLRNCKMICNNKIDVDLAVKEEPGPLNCS